LTWRGGKLAAPQLVITYAEAEGQALSAVEGARFLPRMKDQIDEGHCYPLPPPLPIPDWRALEGYHPRSSQIGVEFSNPAAIGVGLDDLPHSDQCYQVISGKVLLLAKS
jgi:hypothetical protein